MGLVVLCGCLLVAYLPGDRATMARLQYELNHERDRANEASKTVEEQNELIQAQGKRINELNDSLYDAQTDIKGFEEGLGKLRKQYFSEYAPHE